jgi:hypothetical protein
MAALFVYLQNTVARLRERQEGQTMAEYALILGGIAIVAGRTAASRRAGARLPSSSPPFSPDSRSEATSKPVRGCPHDRDATAASVS